MIRAFAAWMMVASAAQAADLTVLSAGAINGVAAELAPGFQLTTRTNVVLRNGTVGGLVRRITAGEPFDVVLMSPAGLAELAKAGKIASGSETALAHVGIGVGIRAGTPTPDISTEQAFRATLLAARAVAYIDPASGGSSGIYLAKLFQTMGIADAITPKSILVQGGLAAERVVDGQAEIALQQISEIVAVPGVTLVGPLPAEIQQETTYSGAIAAGSTQAETGRAFLAALRGPAAILVLTARGMKPP